MPFPFHCFSGRQLSSTAARKRTFSFPPSGDVEILIRVSSEIVSYGNFWPKADGQLSGRTGE
jgi:hypothetical protein